MEIFRMIDRIMLIHKLIQKERTGSPQELARRLGISRGTLYNLIEELKSHDVNITYSRVKESFIYKGSVDIEIHYSIKSITDSDELLKISGGSAYFYFRSFF